MQNRKVIVLEDDPDVLQLVDRVATGDGFEVHGALSLAECRRKMRAVDPTIFIVDVNLPDGSGLSFVPEIREHSRAGILILSARTAEVDQVLGLEMGADDYVAKPFRPRELVARMRALHRRLSARPGEVPAPQHDGAPDFTLSGYQLFLQARRVIDPEGRDIALTAAEFDVFAALMEFEGRIASRDEIIETVRRRNWSGNERAIDGIVSRLRRKLPVPESQPHFIRTVYGVGYLVAA